MTDCTRYLPMSGPCWPIRGSHAFTAPELARLREGVWPRDMDVRWAVSLQDNTLRCWRSWTGACIYEALVVEGDDGRGMVVLVNVLDDPDTYSRALTEESELERFEGVVALALSSEDA